MTVFGNAVQNAEQSAKTSIQWRIVESFWHYWHLWRQISCPQYEPWLWSGPSFVQHLVRVVSVVSFVLKFCLYIVVVLFSVYVIIDFLCWPVQSEAVSLMRTSFDSIVVQTAVQSTGFEYIFSCNRKLGTDQLFSETLNSICNTGVISKLYDSVYICFFSG